MKVLCVGQSAFDITLPMDHYPVENQKERVPFKVECGGGSSSNCAYLLADWGLDTSFAGIVGNDHYGKIIIDDYIKKGVDLKYLEVSNEYFTTCSYIITNTSKGSRTILTNRDKDIHMKPREFKENEFDFILLDGYEKNIALEAAYFTPQANRKSARSVGYRSDACARYERGIDIQAVHKGLMRAVELLEKYADAKFEGYVETGDDKPEPINITLRYAQIKRVLGCEIETEKCLTILERLGFTILGKNDAACKVQVPSYRTDDVTREVDLIEEIARINGYDKISPTLPSRAEAADISTAEKVINKIHSLMRASGLNEIQTSSLIGEPLLKQFNMTYEKDKAIFVENPASEDFAMLRQTLVASILNCMKYNYDNGQKDFWGYEIGRSYLKVSETDEKHSGVKETLTLAGVITGNVQNSLWQSTGEIDFYTVKGMVDKILDELGLTRRIKYSLLADSPLADSHKCLHPYKTAVLTILGKQPEIVGYYGEIHPELRNKLKLNQNAYIFKLDLNMIISAFNESVVRFKKLPQFPEVQRDLAVIVPADTSWDELEKTVKKGVANNVFNGCEVFDVYQGEHVQEGFKSVAFRIKMQDANSTMTDELIETQMANVRATLKKAIPDLSFRE